MKLGVHIGYWGLGLGAAEQLELVQEAERLGYESVWTAEAYGSDAVTILAWLAAQTERIRLGSAILQMPGRSAAMTAMTAATLDQLSGGRVLLGIGTSGPQVAEGWHGQRFGRQLQRTREYVEVVRMALRRERVRYDGETLRLPLPDGPGKALKLTIAPVQERIPVYIAAIGPRNTTLTAEIADGWIPTLFSPEHVAEFRPLLEEGFARAGGGKSFADFDIAPTVSTMVSDDRAAARDAMRPYLALYVGGMGSRKQNFYNALVRRYGFEDAAQRVQDLYLEGRKEEAAAALPGELIDAVSLCGPADVVRDRLTMFRDAGVGTLMVSPMAWSFEDRRRQLRLVAELAGWLPEDVDVREPVAGDVEGIAALVAACDATYRAWAPAGWTPPPPGRELDRWRGRITDGSWWVRIAIEAAGRVVGLVCFTQAVVQRTVPAPPGKLPVRLERPPDQDVLGLDPIPGRAHVAAMFTHPDRWREGIAAGLLARAEDAMREHGYREVQLWTPREAPARRFYEASGWSHDGREQWLAELSLPIVAYVKPL